MSAKKRSKRPLKEAATKETWPGAFKAVALSAVAKGQLVQFGILVVAGIIAWNMDSGDVVSIIDLLLGSEIFQLLGWVFFVATAVGMTALLRSQRKMYTAELERVSNERNHWQETANSNIQPSEYEVS